MAGVWRLKSAIGLEFTNDVFHAKRRRSAVQSGTTIVESCHAQTRKSKEGCLFLGSAMVGIFKYAMCDNEKIPAKTYNRKAIISSIEMIYRIVKVTRPK